MKRRNSNSDYSSSEEFDMSPKLKKVIRPSVVLNPEINSQQNLAKKIRSNRASDSRAPLTVAINRETHSQQDHAKKISSKTISDNRVPLNFTLTTGKKQNSTLLYTLDERQLYVYKQSYKNVKTYNCYISSCKAKVVVNEKGVCYASKLSPIHRHPTVEDIYEKYCLQQKIKTNVKTTNIVANTAGKQSFIRAVFNETVAQER